MNKLKLVKFIVFLLTFILILGMIYASSIIYKKVSATPSPLTSELSLNQSKGSYIADYRFNNDRLYILVKGGGLADRLVVVNPERQQIEATIKTF